VVGGCSLVGSQVIAMGNVSFTDASGAVATIDQSWSFAKESDGSIRIALHHSSLPIARCVIRGTWREVDRLGMVRDPGVCFP
jgi:hypothetical protein